MSALIQQAADALRQASFGIAVTGAGVSVESGIPDFRGPLGIWQKFPPAEYATLAAYIEDPDKVWKFWTELGRELGGCKPNPGHYALAELEAAGHLHAVITQNVDHFHQEAGSKNVIEYHGNTASLHCLDCERTIPFDLRDAAATAPRCTCGGLMKPNVIMFGELIPQQALERADELAHQADLVLIVGTSAQVYPAAGLPFIAKENGAIVIECNMEPTDFTSAITDIFIQGPSGETLPLLVKALG